MRTLLLAAALVVAAGGCDAGPKKYPVAGTVTLDGKPIPDGHLLILPDSATAAEGPEYCPIKDGRYQGAASPGRKRVEIRADRKWHKLVPSDEPGKMHYPLMNYIPERYNDQSTLSLEVKPQPENVADFPLKSK
jgi:hypothetical protein